FHVTGVQTCALPIYDTYFFSFIVTLALAGIWVCCSQWLLQVMVTDSEDYLLFVRQSWPLRFCFGFLIIGWITVLNLLWYTQEERQQSHMRAQVTEKQAKEAELFKLRQQRSEEHTSELQSRENLVCRL